MTQNGSSPPPTVRQDSLPATESRYDGALVNALTGLGTEEDRTNYTVVNPNSRLHWKLSKEQKESLAANRTINRICSIYPSQSLRKGWTVKLDKEKENLVDKFNEYCDGSRKSLKTGIGIKKNLQRALYLARVYGGSCLVMLIDDGLPPEEPVDETRIRSIKGLVPLDRYKIRPVLDTWNPDEPDYFELTIAPGQLKLYEDLKDKVKPDRSRRQFFYRIHPSRVCQFHGVPIPPDLMLDNDGWGMSIPEALFRAFSCYEESQTAALGSLQAHEVFTYRMAGLLDMLAKGKEAALKSRLRLLMNNISSLKGMALDRDKEEASYTTRNVQGMADLAKGFEDRLIAESDVSHTYLFGRSPSGLGATGESEEKTDVKKFEAYQEDEIIPALDQLFKMVWLAKDGPSKGKIPDGWTYSMNPMIEVSPEQRANLWSLLSNTHSTYQSLGVILTEEIREALKNDKENSLNIVFNDELFKKNQAEAEMGAFDFSQMGGDPAAAEAPPPEGEIPPEQQAINPETGEPLPTEPMTTDSRLDSVYLQVIQEAESKFKSIDSPYVAHWISKRLKQIRS